MIDLIKQGILYKSETLTTDQSFELSCFFESRSRGLLIAESGLIELESIKKKLSLDFESTIIDHQEIIQNAILTQADDYILNIVDTHSPSSITISGVDLFINIEDINLSLHRSVFLTRLIDLLEENEIKIIFIASENINSNMADLASRIKTFRRIKV